MAAGKEFLKHYKYSIIRSRYEPSTGMLEETELALEYRTIELAPTKAGVLEVHGGLYSRKTDKND